MASGLIWFEFSSPSNFRLENPLLFSRLAVALLLILLSAAGDIIIKRLAAINIGGQKENQTPVER